MRRLFGLIGTITSVLQNREIGSDTDCASVLVPGKSTNHPAMRLLMTSPTAAQWRVTAFKSQGLKQAKGTPASNYSATQYRRRNRSQLTSAPLSGAHARAGAVNHLGSDRPAGQLLRMRRQVFTCATLPVKQAFASQSVA